MEIFGRNDRSLRLSGLCREFMQTEKPRFILGRNAYGKSVLEHFPVAGFIDEFTSEKEFCGRPIVGFDAVPQNSLILSTVLGKPFAARSRIESAGFVYFDYFAFYRYSGLKTRPVTCWEDFSHNFDENRSRYAALYDRLEDSLSKKVLQAIVNFRLSGDLEFMHGFTDQQFRQYFEDFIALAPAGETFVDVGGFDGYTTLEFARRCPGYAGIHFFEPEKQNLALARKNLAQLANISFHDVALSDRTETFFFQSDGSRSKPVISGDLVVHADRLDKLISGPVSFLKMDIEGAEQKALVGSERTIIENLPRLAISVYHRGDDLIRIPEIILGFFDSYRLFLRHYTEGVDETVMFFVPRR